MSSVRGVAGIAERVNNNAIWWKYNRIGNVVFL